ncbi:MAG: M16 family metallopeptidase [Vicinamibacterales bacterium]
MPLSPTRRVLANGASILTVVNRTTPAVNLLVGVRAGSYQDPSGADGTATLVARLLDRGTSTRTAASIADDLDGRGAALVAGAGRHQTSINVTCLADDFAAIAAIALDCVRSPVFDPREVEIRRAELVTAIREDEDDPAARATDAMMEGLYPRHPYSRRGRGTAASVEGLTPADLQVFHAHWFRPPTLTVAVVGDVDPGHVVAVVAQSLDGWQAPAPAAAAVPDSPAPGTRQLEVVSMMDKAQTDIAYGFVGVRRTAPDYYAAWVMNNALGQYGLGGRLGDSIRERQGMAYYVFSVLDATLGAGPLMIRAGVSPANVEKTIASIDAELTAVVQHGLTPAEIAESKQYLAGSLPRQLETNAAIANFLMSTELFGLGLDLDARLPGLIAGVTDDQVHAAARRLLHPLAATIAVAGPWEGPSA